MSKKKDDNWIHTGNDFADSLYHERFMDDPIFLALLECVIESGLFTMAEFEKKVQMHCKANLLARSKCSHERF